MKQRTTQYNNKYARGEEPEVAVQDVELETVCLAGDHIETNRTQYDVPEVVTTNHNADFIRGCYDYNNGTFAFVNEQGELHITCQDGARAVLEAAGYREDTINVPYTNPETGDLHADVLEHRAKHCEYTRKMLVHNFLV
ncbi:hypothetical protein CMO91_02990 [Candidatus Woesearchaeota archaeon]|nr:hypothetical protein [Candidatus Woesearchaeota archaeon]